MAALRKYPFLRAFEASLAFCLATAPRFYETVGHALDHERMPSEASTLIVKAAKEITKAHGSPPASTIVVLQRIRSMVEDGKVTIERLKEAEAMLALGEDLGAAEEVDAITAEAVPVVTKFAQQDAVEATLSDFGKGMDTQAVAERFDRVAAIGKAREVTGEAMTGSRESFEAVIAAQTGDLLPTGVLDIDNVLLNGGLERRALGMVMATTGAGKSMFLVQVASDALLAGRDVAYVTLELSTRSVLSRVYRNLLNMNKEEMRDVDEAQRRWKHLQQKKVGRLELVYMTAQVSTVADIRRWLKERERETGFRPEVIVTDMGDHLVSKAGSDKRSYDEMRVVYSGLRELAVERDGWSWTASQVKTGNAGKKYIDVDQAADSANKARLADLIIAMSATKEELEEGTRRYATPKRREDESNRSCGPLPIDAGRGRIACINRSVPWG